MSRVRDYYQANTWKFLLFGTGGQINMPQMPHADRPSTADRGPGNNIPGLPGSPQTQTAGEDDEIARLNAIAEAYKTKYKQQSVGVIVRPACVSF